MTQHDLTDILSPLLENPGHTKLEVLISRLSNFFLVAEDTQLLRLYPSHQSLYGIGNIDIHVTDSFKNFDIEVTGLEISPAEGFMVDDLIPDDGTFKDKFSFDRLEGENGTAKLKVSFA